MVDLTGTFRCGHPKSADNRQLIGGGRTRCKICRRVCAAASARRATIRRREAKQVDTPAD